MSRARRLKKARKNAEALARACSTLAIAASAAAPTFAELKAMVAKLEADIRRGPVIRTSRFMPRGCTFEYDEPIALRSVERLDGSNREEFISRRVLVVNADDYRDAVEAADARGEA